MHLHSVKKTKKKNLHNQTCPIKRVVGRVRRCSTGKDHEEHSDDSHGETILKSHYASIISTLMEKMQQERKAG
jgi:hypothetical protein